MEEVFSQIEGNFVGLGVELKTEQTGLNIVNVIAIGPAFEAGIRPGDRIVSVDGKTTKQVSPDTLADMLRGEEGSQVRVEVLGKDNQTRSLAISRRRVEVPSVDEIKMIDEEYHIGYFKLTSFQKTTPRDVDAALWKLHEQGMRSLVIDLRGNPGGLLKAAVDVADKFVMDGMPEPWQDTIGQFLWGFLFDCIHHRGQLSTYLRPMGGKVPSIYGPSADDPGQ